MYARCFYLIVTRLSCLQQEQRSRRHLLVAMSLLARKVESHLLDFVLWFIFAEP